MDDDAHPPAPQPRPGEGVVFVSQLRDGAWVASWQDHEIEAISEFGGTGKKQTLRWARAQPARRRVIYSNVERDYVDLPEFGDIDVGSPSREPSGTKIMRFPPAVPDAYGWVGTPPPGARRLPDCPRCAQAGVDSFRLRGTDDLVFVCPECEALWHTEDAIGPAGFVEFGAYMEDRGRPPLWSELLPE